MHRTFAGLLALLACLTISPCAQASDAYRLLELDGHTVKWGKPDPGSGATLTFAVLDEETTASGSRNCRSISPVGPMLKRSSISRAAFDAELTAAFSMWEKAANVRFERAKDADSADVLISAEGTPDGWAYTDVTPVASPNGKTASLRKAIVCLNPDLSWMTSSPAKGKSGKKPVPGRDVFRLSYVLAHEIGHVLGLDHPGPNGELMSFEYGAKIHGLQPGDIAGAVALYGNPQVPVLASTDAPIAAR